MSTNARGRGPIPVNLLAEVDALPDSALVDERGRAALPEPRYVSDPDFACYPNVAAAIRADLRGEGKYAPHFSPYDVEYRLLPHWRRRAAEVTP